MLGQMGAINQKGISAPDVGKLIEKLRTEGFLSAFDALELRRYTSFCVSYTSLLWGELSVSRASLTREESS